MSLEILFPSKASQALCVEAQHAYYITHYQHVKNYLLELGTVIDIDKDTTVQNNKHDNNFIVRIGDKDIMFDYSDFDYYTVDFDVLDTSIKYFKLHTTKESNPRCLPFPPMSFMDWNLFYSNHENISYNIRGDIFYKCRAYGGAIERRTHVKKILETYENLAVNFTFQPQELFFKSFSNCRMNVIVPGARNDMVDRSHLQSFAFGIPVITPKLSTLLPFNQTFEPNVDYIQCADDYSDVIYLIEKYKDDKKHLDFISKNCKNKFLKTCSPPKVGEWIMENL